MTFPQETPYLSMAKKLTASARIHQWHEGLPGRCNLQHPAGR